MDFEKRLERAIVRGEQARALKGRQQLERALSEEELKNLHTKCRLELSDRIESCLKQLADHFPGFRIETIVSPDGWGGKVSRDDLQINQRRTSRSQYSRLELLIRPYSTAQIVELSGKATIRNKEIFSRTHYQFLAQADLDSFGELIDLWVLEYAEQYAAGT